MFDTESETSSPVTKLHREQATELSPPTSLSTSSLLSLAVSVSAPGPGRPRDAADVTESWRQPPRDLDDVADMVPYAAELLLVGDDMSNASLPLICT